MHRLPSLQWQTWVRLAFVEAGSDWRSLSRLNIVDGQLADFRIAPETTWRNGALGVTPWSEPTGTITANGRPAAGSFSVADPRRADGVAAFGQYGVNEWGATMQTVIGKAAVGAGNFSVADPRHGCPTKFSNVYSVVEWDRHAGAVTSSRDVAIADPRAPAAMFHNAYKRTAWSDPAQTITGQHTPSNGAGCVADPRPGLHRAKGDDWAGAGHYGVVPWSDRTGAVSSAAGYDNGRWSVADPREPSLLPTDDAGTLPAAQDRLVACIRSMDGTWHRPFTTLELAAVQSIIDPEEYLELEGMSDATWRERIGNAVPPAAATAIADTMGRTLLLAWSGESFMLSAVPIWVRPLAIGLAVQGRGGGVKAKPTLAAFQKPVLTGAAFKATKFNSGEDKATFGNQLLAFIAEDFPERRFTQAFYRELAGHFGMIAWNDKHGFWAEYFTRLPDKLRFVEEILGHACYGLPEYTYSDLERVVIARLRSAGIVERLRAAATQDREAIERALLNRLIERYRPDLRTVGQPAAPRIDDWASDQPSLL